MITRQNAWMVVAIITLLAVSTAQSATIYVDAANCPGSVVAPISDIFALRSLMAARRGASLCAASTIAAISELSDAASAVLSSGSILPGPSG